LGFVFGQIGLIGHDLGHRQIFRTTRLFEISSFIVANLLLGWSWTWWLDRHNRHHGCPNQMGDPDIAIPVLAFTEQQARTKRGVLRFLMKYQGYLFLIWELFGWVMFLVSSIEFIARRKGRYRPVQTGLMVVHYCLYFGLLFTCLDVWQAILFFVIHRALSGLYLGSIAASNHKGMLVWDNGGPGDFLRRQVPSSRNVRAHPMTDFWYGGLNYQIEHHHFPTIPRNRLKQAQQTVQACCRECRLSYHETGFLQSYREIFEHLRRVSASTVAPSIPTR